MRRAIRANKSIATDVIGYWVASAGVLLGLVGVVLHWAKNWRAILRVRE